MAILKSEKEDAKKQAEESDELQRELNEEVNKVMEKIKKNPNAPLTEWEKFAKETYDTNQEIEKYESQKK